MVLLDQGSLRPLSDRTFGTCSGRGMTVWLVLLARTAHTGATVLARGQSRASP